MTYDIHSRRAKYNDTVPLVTKDFEESLQRGIRSRMPGPPEFHTTGCVCQ